MPTATASRPNRPNSTRITWITGALACELLGTYRARLVAIAKAGKIRRRDLAGAQPRYSLEDVQQLAAEMMAGSDQAD